MAAKTDTKTMQLIAQVKAQREAIAKLDKPSYKTNCSFSYSEGRHNDAINIHVEKDVRALVNIAAHINTRFNTYGVTAKALGVQAPDFKWQGFDPADWFADIKTRIDKLQIAAKKEKLAELEKRLNTIISPELRAELELEAIAGELGN